MSARVVNLSFRYDPKTDMWTAVASMSISRDAVGVCLLGDKLYAVGGYDGQTYLNIVEAYDPQTNEWTQVRCFISPRLTSLFSWKHLSIRPSQLHPALTCLTQMWGPRDNSAIERGHLLLLQRTEVWLSARAWRLTTSSSSRGSDALFWTL